MRPSARSVGRIESLDLLRALAISLVFLFHYQMSAHAEWLKPAARYGWIGVDLFFTLSGYLIARQLFAPIARGERPDTRGFYLRRALRILPSYLVVLAAYFLVPGFAEGATIAPLWKFLTFTQNFGLDLHTQKSFSNAWSLCVEEQFYLLLPGLTLVFSSRSRPGGLLAGLVVTVAGGMAIRAWAWQAIVSHAAPDELGMVFNREIYYPTYCRLDPLLLGVGAAAWRTFRAEGWRWLERRGPWLALVGSALLAAVAVFFGPQPRTQAAVIFEYPMIATGLACFLALALSRSGSRISVPGARALAELAFTLYLVHKPVIHWVLARGGGLAACAAASIALAWALRQAVELPFLRLRDQLSDRSGKAATDRIMATARSTSGPSGS